MKTVHLVEDNPDNADLVLDILDGTFDVQVFSDGPGLLRHLEQEEPPAVFLLDISLPGMDGVSLLKALRASPKTRHVPAIALTAHAMKNEKERLLDEGFNDYISKPIVDEDALMESLGRLAEASSTTK